jgi:hypothetical protein
LRRADLRAGVVLAIIVAGCGNAATPSPAAPASVGPSTVAVAVAVAPSASVAPPSVAPSPSPTASPSPTPAPTEQPWQTYTSKLNKYTISYPPRWASEPGDKKHFDLFDSLGYIRVYVGRHTYEFTVDAADFAKQDIAAYKKDYKAKLVSNKPLNLKGGYRGRIVELTGVEDGVPISLTHIVVSKGRVAYDINMYIDYPDTSAGRELFKPIYTSWRPTS